MNKWFKHALVAGVAAAIALTAICALAEDKVADKKEMKETKTKVELSQLPAAAQKKLTELAGGAALDKVMLEQEEGGAEYMASWKKDGRTHEAKVTAAGDVLGTESEVLETEVPAAVVAAVKQKASQGAQLSYEQKNMILYRVKVVAKDGKETHLAFSPDGHEKMMPGMHKKGCECKECKCAKCECGKDDKDMKCAADAKCDSGSAKCEMKDMKDMKDMKPAPKDVKVEPEDKAATPAK